MCSQSREVLAMRMFAFRRFGSRLFATFANGYVYEYAPGLTLTYELCIDPHVYPLVAQKIGELHREMKLHVPASLLQGRVAKSLNIFQ